MKKGKTTAGQKNGQGGKAPKENTNRSTERRSASRQRKKAERDATAFLREFIARSDRTAGE